MQPRHYRAARQRAAQHLLPFFGAPATRPVATSPAPLPANATDTSRAAARAAAPRAATLRDLLYRIVVGTGPRGATIDELVCATGKLVQSVSARVNELRHAGRIVDSRQRRPTRSGCRAIVWIAAARRDETEGTW